MDKPNLIRVADRKVEYSFSHPLNPKSEIHGTALAAQAGLQRVGISILRIPPGKESFCYHRHHGEEEFMYILSGRGMVELGDEEHEVGAGDFLGFPTPSVAHHVRNPFDEELVYLSGGERNPVEIAEFPRLGKRFVRVGGTISLHSVESQEPFGMGIETVKSK